MRIILKKTFFLSDIFQQNGTQLIAVCVEKLVIVYTDFLVKYTLCAS